MILNSAFSVFNQWKIPKKMVYLAASGTKNNLNTEKLREQLDHLQKEAQSTRNKGIFLPSFSQS